MPMRSGARQRPAPSSRAMTLRHRYDDVGLPCRNTIGSPTPTSTQAMWLSSTRSRRRSYQSAAEMAWLICWVGAPFLAACILPQAGVARRGGGPRFAPTTRHARAPVPGDQRLRLSALAACLLPGRRPPARVAAVLRAPLPDGRAEQLVL